FDLDGSAGISVSFSGACDVYVFAADQAANLGSALGSYQTGSGYSDGVNDHWGNLLVSLFADSDGEDLTLPANSYITLKFQNGSILNCYLPSTTLPRGESV